MPRKPRMFLPGHPAHLVQRGHNRQPVFFAEEDYLAYQSFLSQAIERYDCALHAYVLMTNHVHLLMTPSSETGISQALQYTGQRYVPYINKKYERSGTLWEGRFRASIIDSNTYLLACYRYIEMNPVRAGMVTAPEAYRWSSYACNAGTGEDPLVTPHSRYAALGTTRDECTRNYRRLFKAADDGNELQLIREHTRSGTPMGDDKFRDEIENTLSVRTGQPQRGRPEKPLADPLPLDQSISGQKGL
ncbi:transposase [Mangrovimicrobium sediminis]|uniref:Transposase n=2 Tax=Mangrovimicrobium sediminis TaxID=2562682 RepID=A0A4Z0M929_9GAMM|nr:transposase [Haliea sp. SAOS-164]